MAPAASAEKPSRLIVWMHGKGGSANQHVEPLAPQFIEKGFALLVFTQKNWMKWNGGQMLKTVEALSKVEGIEGVKKVIREGRVLKILSDYPDPVDIPQKIKEFGGFIEGSKIEKARMKEVFVYYTGVYPEE